MKFLRNAVEEIWSMFVDDPLFAGLLIAWVAVLYFGHSAIPRNIAGPVLFAGLAGLLFVFAFRQAQKSASSK